MQYYIEDPATLTMTQEVPPPEQTETCEEASSLFKDRYIPCGMPTDKFVYHRREHRTYPMCKMCAFHNLKNRGGQEAVSEEELQRRSDQYWDSNTKG